ncbi:OmpW family outer membrane protein [Azospirillum sp. SYSU D00513]|uniref:OmpW/AlkL family protein n=1 Tax=Azospirillum sp. SYSU D00513 TaxID=2812561 RepID=UPI001A971B89|nr:OmpW family outer membrane protein [Azospirillum sp. SYSU D00513]
MVRCWHLAVVAAALLAAPAGAQDFTGKKAGDIVLRARALAVVPDEKADIHSGGADTGLDARVSNDVIPELDLSYFVTDNIAFELIAGTTKHDVKVKQLGADLGSVRLLPPTLTVQYHFLPKERFSPYVGAGVNWTLFYDEKSSALGSVDYSNSLGLAAQAGFDYFITDNWLLNVDVKKIWLDTNVKVSGGLRADANLNPWLFGVGVGYKF